jgi:hypothetical protein
MTTSAGRWWLAVIGCLAIALAGCALTNPEPSASTSLTRVSTRPTTTGADTSLPGASTAEVRKIRSGDIAGLVDVRMARHDGYDRLVFEFTDRVPGYTIGYRPLPAHEDASGFEIPLPDAVGLLQVSLSPASGDGWTGDEPTYLGPSTVSADTTVITEAKAAGDFEAVLTWAVGVRAERPFAVSELDGPPRLVVDVAHR